MKTGKIFFALLILLMGLGSFASAQEKDKSPSSLSAGVLSGYNRGYGIQGNLTLHNVHLPFELRVGVGYSFINPGRAMDARRVFINNNTNGTPEKSGRSIDYRFDFLFPKSIFGLKHSYLILGPRGSSFKGNFAYIGGNEEFDVVSRQWGAGAGIESHFSMSGNLNLVIAAGLDYYLPSTLHGHDTSYSPDDDNVNPRNDIENDDEPFTYKDANKIIYQPAFMPFAMIGLTLDL
ncbi:MAG: hypothetical protein P1P86_14790 [Bacteroidales bacterium]|nr:hypothetical protein [Bacteroidales bacterium]